MKTVNTLIRVVSVFLLLLITGCATVPMMPDESDSIAKSFAAKEDMSSIYIYRNETFGGAVKMIVTFNGMVIGQSGPKTYFLLEVEPGTHQVSSIGETTSTVSLDTEAGKSYFIWQEIKWGMWAPRTLLHQVSDEVGKKGVLECKRAESNY